MAQLSDLYFGSFTVTGAKDLWTAVPAARSLAPGVCYCCKTAMAHGANGAVYLAWRHVYPGDMRDIAFVASRDGGRTFGEPLRVHEDRWSIKGCPDDGPSMALDGAGSVHIVWPTMVVGTDTATKTIMYSTTTDGRSFSAPVALPSKGHAHHPQVVVAPGDHVVVAWDEAVGDVRAVVIASGAPVAPGHLVFSRLPDLDTAGLYPTLATSHDMLLTAWVSRSHGRTPVIRLQQIVASSLP